MIRGRERGRLMRKPRKEGKVEGRVDDRGLISCHPNLNPDG
jgi:hypothetical protein